MKTSNAVGLAAAAALAIALTGGTAVGAAKITSKQIARNAVLAKHIKAGAVGSEELADGAVTGPKLASGVVTGPKLADGSVTGPKLADDSVTGAKVDEATLGTVPNALAVGGVRVVPVTASMADNALLTLISTNDAHVLVQCFGGQASAEFSSPALLPFILDANREGVASLTDTYGPGSFVQLSSSTGNYTMTVARAGGGFTMLQMTANYSLDAIGTNDCFFRGTLSTTQ